MIEEGLLLAWLGVWHEMLLLRLLVRSCAELKPERRSDVNFSWSSALDKGAAGASFEGGLGASGVFGDLVSFGDRGDVGNLDATICFQFSGSGVI